MGLMEQEADRRLHRLKKGFLNSETAEHPANTPKNISRQFPQSHQQVCPPASSQGAAQVS
jgi:hypothetical protein